MKKILGLLVAGNSLEKEEARQVISQIGSGAVNPSQISAFLMGIQQKGISAIELQGFREGMLELALNPYLEDFDAIDVCGTGGDGKDTFNISTTSAFLVAGAGVKVAKHGNHGVSSAVGSSTVLEHLGIKFTNDGEYLKRKIETANICYLHAPLFHPAMKYVAPIRKELGIKTFFNILGPLLNPAKVKTQLTGVSDLGTFEVYKILFAGAEGRYAVVHSLDGYDEISLTGDFRVAYQKKDAVFRPSHFNLGTVLPEEIKGGNSLEESGEILLKILKGEGSTAQNAAVIVNAGLAISLAKDISFEEGIALSKESLESGSAYACFKKLVE